MRPIRISIIGSLAALTIWVAPSAQAQIAKRVVFTPYVGLYVPTNDVAVVSDAISGVTLSGRAEHRASPAFGLNMSYWLSDQAAIEVGGLYAFSDLRGTLTAVDNGEVFTESLTDNAYVMVGSAKFLMHLLPSRSKFNLRLGLGPAIIHRGGTAYKSDEGGDVTGLTNVGAALSLCTKIPITNAVGIRVRAEDFFYQARLGVKGGLDGSDLKFDRKTQNDLVFSAGVQLFMNR